MQPIHLICGVPGSGKTWVAKQCTDKYEWVPHDDHAVAEYYKALIQLAKWGDKPVLGEAPFRVSVLVDQLKALGAYVEEHWIIEPLDVTKQRYEQRMSKPFPKQHYSNLMRYEEHTRGHRYRGTSEEVLKNLRNYEHT